MLLKLVMFFVNNGSIFGSKMVDLKLPELSKGVDILLFLPFRISFQGFFNYSNASDSRSWFLAFYVGSSSTLVYVL